MATAALLPTPRAVFFDSNGNPLNSGFVYTYVPGGTTFAATWQDANQVTLNSNPIVLDAVGSALIYGNGSYQITVTDSYGNQVPGYSGLSMASVTSTALAGVLTASTLEGAANQLLADGLSVTLDLTDGLDVTGTSFAGTYLSNAAQIWVNVVAAATNAVEPEVAGQFILTSNVGTANQTTAQKVALTATVSGGADSADVWGLTTLTTGFGGTYKVCGYECTVSNAGADTPTLDTATSVYGQVVTSYGPSNGTAGLFINYGASANWFYGVAVTSALTTAYFEDSTAATGVEIAGTHTTGIDMGLGTCTHSMVLANNTPIMQYDARTPEQLRNLITINNNENGVLVLGDNALSAASVANTFIPATNNVYMLGSATNQWTEVWAVNGTVQTSDARLKTDIAPLPPALPIIEAIQPVTYRWKVGRVDMLDDKRVERPGKRTHWGFLASDVREAMAETGRDFGGYVRDAEGTEHLRPDQLIPVLWQGLKEAVSMIRLLEGKVADLEVATKA